MIPNPASFKPLLPRPKTGRMRNKFIRCCCAPCSRRSTRPPIPATLAWPLMPTRISPALSGAIRTCWCTVSSKLFWKKPSTSCPPCPRRVRPMPSWRGDLKKDCPPKSRTQPKSRAKPAPRAWPGRPQACIAVPTSAGLMKPAVTWRRGLSASTCASTWVRNMAGSSLRQPALVCLSPWTRCMWKAWCTSPSWVVSISALMKRARNCAASAPAPVTPLARGCAFRLAGWIWTDARSISDS